MEFHTAQVGFQFKTQTTLGEEVRIAGNCEALGNWNQLSGPILCTDHNRYPLWTLSFPISLPMDTELEYKYVYVCNGTPRWEELPCNRKIKIEHKNCLVEDEALTNISRIIIKQQEVSSTMMHSYETSSYLIDENIAFTNTDAVIIASMRLPVKVSINPNYDPNDPSSEKWLFEKTKGIWLTALFDIALQEGIQFLWVGWPGIWIDDENEQEDLRNILKERYFSIPLFIPESIMEAHMKFCNLILFPIFNSIIGTNSKTIPQYPNYLWEAYKNVNSRFADAIMNFHSRQMIWIHDYHLLLTPSFISRRTHKIVNLGLFMHVPFPSSEIYRVLPHRETLLNAMLCCDLIGFHLFAYARHFLAACKFILGIDHQLSRGGYLMINYFERRVMIRIGHLGIEPRVIQEALQTEEFKNIQAKLSTKYKGKKVLLGIDPLHVLSGITLKLNAFREALRSRINFVNKAVLLQILTEAKTVSTPEREEIREELYRLKDDINREFRRDVVEFIETDVSGEARYAYMSISNGIVNTSLRDGLCLTPFEFIVVNMERDADIVISEFAGVTRALSSLRRVNPFNISELEGEIYNLMADEPKNHSKRQRDLGYILTNTTFHWAKNFLTDLKRAVKDPKNYQYVTHGLGDRLKLIALNKNFRMLDSNNLLKAYGNSRHRVFFFDNEGTLCNLLKNYEIDNSIGPSEKILNSLAELCKDERNNVFVITGRSKDIVERWYGKIPLLGMAAEYGAFIKQNMDLKWELSAQGSHLWKETAKQIIEAYVMRTEGSRIDEKECSVVFQYRDTDLDLGAWQAKELVSHLEILLKPFLDECEVSVGLGYVEVKPRGISKGTTVYKILEEIYERQGPVDFILAIGDDVSDEEMFKVLHGLKREKSHLLDKDPLIFTCTVGKKPSQAELYVNDVNEVQHMLDMIRGCLGSFKKNFSHDDLISLSRNRPTPLLMTPDVKKFKRDAVLELNESEEDEAVSPRQIFRDKKRRSQTFVLERRLT